MRRYLILALAAVALVVPAGAAAAKKPSTTVCRNKIINQWEGTGKIKTTYPIACYRAALKYVQGKADISTYSSLGDDIKLALQAALERKKGVSNVPLDVGKHYNANNASGSKGGGSTSSTTTTGSVTISKPPRGGAGGTPSSAGPTSDSGSGTPLPILVLGGVAIALIAAGAIGTGVRYQRRRSS